MQDTYDMIKKQSPAIGPNVSLVLSPLSNQYSRPFRLADLDVASCSSSSSINAISRICSPSTTPSLRHETSSPRSQSQTMRRCQRLNGREEGENLKRMTKRWRRWRTNGMVFLEVPSALNKQGMKRKDGTRRWCNVEWLGRKRDDRGAVNRSKTLYIRIDGTSCWSALLQTLSLGLCDMYLRVLFNVHWAVMSVALFRPGFPAFPMSGD